MRVLTSTQGEILAFDLGGTMLRAGSFRPATGALERTARMPSDGLRALGDFRERLERALQQLAGEVLDDRPAAVSLAVPGPVKDGVVDRLPSLFGPAYEGGLDFVALARGLWGDVPVTVANDLTAAGHRYLALGHRDFAVLTLGSGVGGKVFVDGRPLLGARGYGGEIGHWRVPGAPPVPCDCGGIGHLSALASGRGALRLLQWRAAEDPKGFGRSLCHAACAGHPEALTPERVTEVFLAGDEWAVASLTASAEALGAALAAIGLATGVDRHFLTGGFAVGAGEPFRRLVCAAAEVHAWGPGPPWDERVSLPPAGEEPGLLGAGLMALQA